MKRDRLRGDWNSNINIIFIFSPSKRYHNGIEKWFLRQSAKGLMPENIRTRKKSALPKDQGTEQLYKKMASEVFKTSHDFISHFLDIKKMQQLCAHDFCLNEQDRALLFRTMSLCYWQESYKVNVR